MNTGKATGAIDENRRRLLGTATMGVAAAGAASLLPELVAGDALAQLRTKEIHKWQPRRR